MDRSTDKTILVLPSWYPHKLSPFDGDFIQRHVQAISAYAKQVVIFVVKDEAGKITRDVLVEKNECKNLTEIIAYYKPCKTGLKITDKIISQRKYTQLYTKLVEEYIIKNGKPSLVHVHVAMKAGLQALRLKKQHNIPFIVTEHWSGYYKNCQPNVYTGNWLLNRLNKKVLQQSSLLITVSGDLGRTINDNFIAVPYSVMPNVVDTNLFFYKPVLPKRFRFIHPSGLIHVKNPEGIIAACKLVKEKGYDFELQVLGPENIALRDVTAGAGLLNTTVFFNGEVSYGDVATQMQQSSALLMFSRHENMSCVVLESLCCGLPVICTRVGGLPEVMNEANGLMVESENVQQLATAMCSMMDNYTRYNREAIAIAAKQQFNYDAVAQQHLDIYNKVLTAERE